jgi:hypothetical protein
MKHRDRSCGFCLFRKPQKYQVEVQDEFLKSSPKNFRGHKAVTDVFIWVWNDRELPHLFSFGLAIYRRLFSPMTEPLHLVRPRHNHLRPLKPAKPLF